MMTSLIDSWWCLLIALATLEIGAVIIIVNFKDIA
jgi:hypothetical protein